MWLCRGLPRSLPARRAAVAERKHPHEHHRHRVHAGTLCLRPGCVAATEATVIAGGSLRAVSVQMRLSACFAARYLVSARTWIL